MQAVIFDMDGLMIDSERICFEGFIKEFQKYGKKMTINEYQLVLGRNKKAIHAAFKKEFGADFPIEEIHTNVLAYIDDQFRKEGVPLKEGLIDLLRYLKAHHIKTMVATSSSRKRVDFILERANLTSFFDNSICGDEVTIGKPNPEIFIKACKKLNVDPEETIVLEDSEMGILAANEAGIKVICIPDMKYPAPEYAQKTYRIADSLAKLMDQKDFI